MRRAHAIGHARIGKRLDILSVADHQEISSLPTSPISNDTLNNRLIKSTIMPGFRPAWTASTSGWQRVQCVALTRRIRSTVEQAVWIRRGTANTSSDTTPCIPYGQRVYTRGVLYAVIARPASRWCGS